MEESISELKELDNIFDEYLNSNNIIDIDKYSKNNPKHIAIDSEIFNSDILAWKGKIDITLKEKKLKIISEKLDTIINVVDVKEKEIIISFNRGKSILSLNYKNLIRRNTENKRIEFIKM